MITTFTWEVLLKNEKDFTMLERLAVDGGWLYRTTERFSAFSDYKTILAQQVTFVPTPSEPAKSHFETVGKLAAALPAKTEDKPGNWLSDETKRYCKVNKWTRDSDDDIRDSQGKRMIWYKSTRDDQGYDIDNWKAAGVDGLFTTEEDAITAHKLASEGKL